MGDGNTPEMTESETMVLTEVKKKRHRSVLKEDSKYRLDRRGGRRPGAGRKKMVEGKLVTTAQIPVTLQQKEAFHLLGGTKWVRAMLDMAIRLQKAGIDMLPILSRRQTRRMVPLHLEGVQAGLPTGADGAVEREIDFNDMLCAERPESTYCLRVSGESMIDAGIESGDLLVVDAHREPHNRDIVIARLNDEFTVKRFVMNGGVPELHPENSTGRYPVIRVKEYDDFEVVGVVRYTIKKFA